MMKVLLLLVICLLSGYLCDSYRAGIVQLAEQILVERQVEFVYSASEQKVDILVFPEGSLKTGSIEVVDVGSLPCDTPNDRPDQGNMSCVAKETEIYIIFDLMERGETCKKGTKYCDLGFYVYNTAVVLDRRGVVIEKYRKINPYIKFFKPGNETDYGLFRTDFGVHFGLFICFDILFKHPSEEIIRKYQINNIIYPTQWVDTLFVQASPIQQAYSEFFQVNLLAADCVATSALGSGIYSKGKPIITNDTRSNKIMVADLPIFEFIEPPLPTTKPLLPWSIEEDSHLQQIIPSDEIIELKFSNLKSHSCTIRYRSRIKSNIPEYFLFGSFNTQKQVKFESCVMMNCGIEKPLIIDLDHCKNVNPKTIFDFVEVIMTVGDATRVVYPLVTTSGERVLSQFEKMMIEHFPNKHFIQLNQVDDPISFVVHFGVF